MLRWRHHLSILHCPNFSHLLKRYFLTPRQQRKHTYCGSGLVYPIYKCSEFISTFVQVNRNYSVYPNKLLSTVIVSKEISLLDLLLDVAEFLDGKTPYSWRSNFSDKEQVEYSIYKRLEGREFEILESYFDAKHDPEQADMLAVIYAQLRIWLSPELPYPRCSTDRGDVQWRTL